MRGWAVALASWALIAGAPVSAAPGDAPRIESRNGRHALMVDGAPFLMLGVQANNSSNYPAMLPQVWPMVAAGTSNDDIKTARDLAPVWEADDLEGRLA